MRPAIAAIFRFIGQLKRPSKKGARYMMKQRGETPASYTIREAVMDDVPKLAALHVKTWAETHWMAQRPPVYATRERQWKEIFAAKDGNWFCLVVEDANKQLVGFAKGDKYAHSDLPSYAGQLNKIYLLRTHQRIGLGKNLFCAVVNRFLQMNIQSIVLFGNAENPSIYFYEAMGGERLYAANGAFHGGFGWKDLSTLAGICGQKN